jgi:hypothetical protein
MHIEISTVALILGCLGFYIQLLQAQRRKTKQWERDKQAEANRKKGNKHHLKVPEKPPVFGTFSHRKRDWAIGAAGYLLMMAGVAAYLDWLHNPTFKQGWWFPMMCGIFLFSWFFY